MAVPPLRQLGGAPAAMKGRGAAPWASRGRNRNTSASSAAARSLTSSLGSAPSSVTTAGTTRVSTPSLLAQTRSTRRPAASGEDEEGHASRRADWRRCQQCSTTCRRSPRKLLAAVVRRVLHYRETESSGLGAAAHTRARAAHGGRPRALERRQIIVERVDKDGAVHPQVFEGDTTAGWQCGTGSGVSSTSERKRGLTPAARPTGRAPQGVAPSATPQSVHDVRVL
jgi:hypothetical protein